MTNVFTNPGEPPLPPDDLGARVLAVGKVAAGTILFRIYRSTRSPLYFGPRSDPRARGRWDGPDDGYGVCYLAEHGHIAFSETLLRDVERDDVSEAHLSTRSLARIRVERDLVVALMHGPGLRRMKATAAMVHGPYATTWAWSKALHSHPSRIDGIRYRTRHDDDGYGIALFTRASSGVTILESVPLLSLALADELGRWLDRYALALTP